MSEQMAWAAGLFEGEGTMFFNGPSSRTASLTSTDLDVLERFREVVECGVVEPRRPYNSPEHHKQAYVWRCHFFADLERVLRAFYPFLGERRRARVDELLANPPLKYTRRGTPKPQRPEKKQCAFCKEEFVLNKLGRPRDYCNTDCRDQAKAIRSSQQRGGSS